MTARERAELAQLVRRREGVAVTAAKQRAAELLAQAEADLAAEYKVNDARWATITAAAEEAVQAADAQIAAICRAEGIAEEFRPLLYLNWYKRGENRFAERRAELRSVAQTRIKALELAARAEIARRSVAAQTSILAGGLAEGAAKAMLDVLPSVDALMPALAVDELEAMLPRGPR